MNSPNRCQCIASSIIALLLLGDIRCGLYDNIDIRPTEPFKDVAEAINHLHRSLPDQMSLESRCKTYAVLLSMFKMKGSPNQLALLQLSTLQEEILNLLYEEINEADMAQRYIATIDIYRTSHLEPAFLDMVECLRKIDSPLVRTYLNDKELNLIINLYQQALRSPTTPIDLDSIDLSQYHPVFRTALRNLFERHFESTKQMITRSLTRINWLGSRAPQLDSTNQSQQAEQLVENTDEQLRQIQLKKMRQNRFRQRHLARIREKDRIRQKRKREWSRLWRQPKERVPRPPVKPEGMTDKQFEKLLRQRSLKRERQKRYREKNLERLKASERDRQRQRRKKLKQQRQQDPNVQPAPHQVPSYMLPPFMPAEQQPQDQGQSSHVFPCETSSVPAPTILESSFARPMQSSDPFVASEGPGTSSNALLQAPSRPSIVESRQPSSPRSLSIGDYRVSSPYLHHRCQGYNYISDSEFRDEEAYLDQLLSAPPIIGPTTGDDSAYDDLISYASQFGNTESVLRAFSEETPLQREIGGTLDTARQRNPSSQSSEDKGPETNP